MREIMNSFGSLEPCESPGSAGLSALTLLMLGILANYHNLSLALDDLALLAHGLYGRSDFHL